MTFITSYRRSLFAMWHGISVAAFCMLIAQPAFAGDMPTLAWTDSWHGPTNHQDHADAVCVLPNSSIVVAARSYDPALVSNRLVLLCYDQQGKILWHAVETTGSRATNMILSATGDLLITGYAPDHGPNLFVRRVNPANGAVVWHHVHPADVVTEGFGPAVAENLTSGEVLVASTLDDDSLVLRYALADGALINMQTFDGPQRGVDMATSIAPRAAGGFVIAGPQDLGRAGGYRTIACAADGSILWNDHEHGAIGNIFTPAWLGVDREGNTLVGGGPETACGVFEFRAWKIDPAGKRVWTRHWPTTACGSAEPADFALGADGSIAMAGHALLGSNYDIAALRVDASGAMWARTWDGPAHTTDLGIAVAIDPAGSLLVAGRASIAVNNLDFAAIAWTSAGDLLFSRTDGVQGAHEIPTDIALDAARGFAIVGSDSAPFEAKNALTAWYTRPLTAGDVTGDGIVNVNDLLAVVGAWGPCPKPPAACSADLNDDGAVDVNDLLLVIGNWD